MPPVALGATRKPALWLKAYEQTYLERDVRDLLRVADLVSFRQLLRLVALRTGQILNVSELARDAKLSVATASRHLSVLEASFVVSRTPPFLASRTTRLSEAFLHQGATGKWSSYPERPWTKEQRGIFHLACTTPGAAVR
jgi:uncharacterized protein